MAAPTSLIMNAPLLTSLDLKTGVGVPTFDRPSDATFISATTGLVTTANFIENLALNSEEFDTYNNFRTTVDPDTDVAPDGETTADSIFETTDTNTHHSNSPSFTINTGKTHNASFFFKKLGRSHAGIDIFGTSITATVLFDLDAANVEGSSGSNFVSANVVSADNGFLRCDITFTVPVGPTVIQLHIYTNEDGSTLKDNYTGDVTKGVIAWGAQLVEDNVPGEYVKSGATPGILQAPRFEAEGFLTEGASTNLSLSSEDLLTGWTQSRCTVLADQTTAPDGNVTADEQTEDTSNNSHRSFQSQPYVKAASAIVTISVFCKAGNVSNLDLRCVGTSSLDSANAAFNTVTGVLILTDTTGVGYSVISTSSTALVNGWFRYTVTAQTGTDTTFRIHLGMADAAGARSYQGSTANFMFLWGSQAEILGFATSYIPTTTATVTRAQDVLTYDAANFPALNADFSIAIDIDNKSDGGLAGAPVALSGLTGTNDIAVNTVDRFQFTYGGVASVDSVNFSTAGKKRVIVTWENGGDQKLYTETVLQDTDANVNAAGALTFLAVGRRSASNANFFGHLVNLRTYSTALTQEEIDDEFLGGFGINSLINSFINSSINTSIND